MADELYAYLSAQRPRIEEALVAHLPQSAQYGATRLNEAIREAVFPGGKRFRPLLTLLGARLAGGEERAALPAACAVEFLHTSSLVLDDLPAMDDANWRRNRPALHLVYGEGVALLAALSLLNEAYALLTDAAAGGSSLARLLVEATRCIGADGMIGGQAVDLEAEAGGSAALASRNLKTTALMRLTMSAGALAQGANEEDVQALARYGEGLGVAYQIRDDLLDEMGEAWAMGKPARQDARHRRASFVRELGIEGSCASAHRLLTEATAVIKRRFGERQETLLLAAAAGQVLEEVESFSLMAPVAGD